MITLIQFPWSPFCITARRMLERNKIPFRVRNIPSHDRSEVIKATGGNGYTVPCVVDGRKAISDTTAFGQEVARYLDRRFKLGLFPKDKEGIQFILSRYIENDLEDVGFRVNDSYLIPSRPLVERVMLTRFKERKFGKGCVAQWTKQRPQLNAQFVELLKPIESMLSSSRFLVAEQPLFVDYNLYGIIENYLHNGKTKLPHWRNLTRWHADLSRP